MSELSNRSRDIGEFVPGPDDDMIVCRCEEVTKGEIRKAVHEGLWTIAEIRRYLRCGMPGTDLRKAGKGNCSKRAKVLTCTFRASYFKSTYETNRDACVCG